jgi:hypothetical protein
MPACDVGHLSGRQCGVTRSDRLSNGGFELFPHDLSNSVLRDAFRVVCIRRIAVGQPDERLEQELGGFTECCG